MLFSVFCAFASGIVGANGATVILDGEPKPYNGSRAATSNYDFFSRSAVNEFANISAQLLMSSHDNEGYFDSDTQILPSSDSFIRGAIQAWGEHLHLVIAPEEVWLTILAQLNFYMSAHLGDIRNVYDYNASPMVSIDENPDWFLVISGFYKGIQARVRNTWLHNWFIPNFSTSTDDDVMAAQVMAMGLTKKSYVKYNGALACALPSATLMGVQQDWEQLLRKLDQLPNFGPEPTAYKARLVPILTRFVNTFKEPGSNATKNFWEQIVIAKGPEVCGGYNISGWITGFLFWDTDGKPYGRDKGHLALDNVSYPSVNIQTLPAGYTWAPFTITDFNKTHNYEAFAMSGTMGKRIELGAPEGYLDYLNSLGKLASYNYTKHGTLTPLSAWVIYGPVVHNATNKSASWKPEPELVDLIANIRGGPNGTQCMASPLARRSKFPGVSSWRNSNKARYS